LTNASMIEPKGEPLFDPPRDVRPMVAVRGSVLVLDWRWLREVGYFEKYEAALGAARGLLDITATEWVPFPHGMAHWQALDALGLSPALERDTGKFVGKHLHNVVLNTLIRLAGKLGVTPWAALMQCHKLWMRSWQGGGMAVYRTGERSARLEILNAEVVQSRAFRNGLAGAVEAGVEAFCQKASILEKPDERTATSFVLRVSWQR